MNTPVKLSLGLIFLTLLASCNEDTDNPANDIPVTVQFGVDFSLAENDDLKKVSLSLGEEASSNGWISVKITTSTPDAFETEPAVVDGHIEIPVSKGDEEAFFNLIPVDDQLLSENKIVEFELSDMSDGFISGAKTKTTATILDDESPATVNFAADKGSVPENDSEGFIVYLALSTIAPESGQITLKMSGEAIEGSFTTEPAFNENRELTIPVAVGASDISFKVIPVKDPLLQGHRSVNFDIASVTGAINKGSQLSFELVIIDEELIKKPKSYESFGGSWRNKQTYEYDEQGRIAKVHWESETPNFRSGTHTYSYADNGLIERINRNENDDEYFYQIAGRIFKSETVNHGVVDSYKLYDYDGAGNLGGIAIYDLQPNGEFTLSFIIINLFFDHGSIFKELTYVPGEGPDDHILVRTRTYDHYMDVNNLFPMASFFPYDGLQDRLPTMYQLEEGEENLEYDLSYEFDAEGLVSKRNVTGPAGTEVTYYDYY